MPDAPDFTIAEHASAQEAWRRCYAYLTRVLDATAIRNWIDRIEPRGYVGNQLTVRVPSEPFAMYLEENFGEAITTMLATCLNGNETILNIEAPKSLEASPMPESTSAKAPSTTQEYGGVLNEAMSFANFYESDCNRVARTIGESVAIRPGQAPLGLLFIYGPSGVGKTHLVQAIGLRTRQLHPELRVCYVSSAKFEAQYVHDARFNDRSAFISYYQQIDVLIIDDIQGLMGKEKTQQAFFEIFNNLTNLNKQIILTSDIPPVELRGMEERLITRIQSSLMLPLERPDLELRRKILRGKVAESGVELGEEVVEFIAESMQRNVRELDGTVKTLLTYSQIQQRPIDIQFARTVMSQSISLSRREVTMEVIQQVIAQEYQVEVSQLRSSTRRADIVLPRQLVMYMTKKHTEHSLGAIAQRLGRKNHTTVMHGIKAISDRMSVDEAFRHAVESLEHQILAC